MALTEPEDWRLHQLEKRVDRIEPLVTDVAVMKSEMRNLTRAVDANTVATQHVAEQLEQAQMEPMTRWRAFRSGVGIAIIGAMAGGVFILLGVLLSGGH